MMDRRSVRLNGGGGGRRNQESDAGEETATSRGGRTVTVTSSQRVVTRRSAAGTNSLNYEVDPWETSPKTDYTYSRTRSYLKQPVVEAYISPNMSRQGLRRSATPVMHEYASTATQKNSDAVRNLALDGSYEEEAVGGGRGVGDGGGALADTVTQASRRSGSGDTYMTLRSRTLMTQHESGGWHKDDTYMMRNMHGTDFDEEVSDTESTQDRRLIVIENRSLADLFSTFFVTVVQTCWTVVTYLPRMAVSKASTLVTGASKSSDYARRTTKRTRLTASTTSNTVLVSDSRWRNLQNAVLWAFGFLLVTLPVGLVSWAVFGMMSSAKLIGNSAMSVWHWVEELLESTITKTARVTDAAVLSRTSLPRRRCGCLCLVPFLFLVPLLVFGLMYASTCRTDDVAVVGSTVYDRFSTFFFPLFTTREEEEWEEANDVTEATVVVTAGGAGKADADEGGVKTDVSLMAVAEMEKRMHKLFLVFAANHKGTAQAEQDRALSAFRSHLIHLVKMIVQRELQVQRISIKTAEEDGRAVLVAEQRKQMAALQDSMDSLAAKANGMSAELNGLKASLSAGRSEPPPANNEAELLKMGEQMKKLNVEFVRLKEKYDDLTTTLIRTRIHEYFVEVMSSGAFGAGSAPVRDSEAATEAGDSGEALPFGVWLDRRFTSREDMNAVLEMMAANITKEINEKTAADEGLMAKIAQAAVVAKWTSEEEKRQQDASAGVGVIGSAGGATEGSAAPCTLCKGQLTVGDVLRMIRTELGIYDADKTGKVDYALESAGGSVISVRCSQTYQLQTAQTSVFGIPLWYTYNSPRVVIQPGVHPGECWAFTGSQGHVVVQLSRQIFVTEVSIEHIPRTLSPSGRIDSAPRDFEIWGLESESDVAGAPLGNFTYDDSGTPIQSFSVQSLSAASFKFVELRIKSNYGQENYTCLYRFRVHGNLDRSLA